MSKKGKGAIRLYAFNSKQYECPFDCFIDILKGKWRTTILLLLAQKPQRFAQLQRQIGGISAKVLSENLQVLEANTILHREVYPTVPPTVEYSLTEKGTVLIHIMNDINEWSHTYLINE
ncbi:winged helix-turn-helix transcriptional regulator [Megasphaera cerevisiae]|uniref:winged helix-turn-helix transcriptional regulator n=1 Tax=Megasphaera cerevisiae TaxID=39029 RepID=UPI001F35A37E|nr:helix-turn-helix domain-containing protein [Megasphaera cerevisiae]